MSGKRDIQKRSKAVQPKRGKLEYFNSFRLGDGPRQGLGVVASNAAAMALQGVASFAGTFAAMEAGRRRDAIMVKAPVGGDEGQTAPAAPAGSALPATADAAPGSRFDAARFAGRVKPGAVRNFLRAHFPGQKPHLTVAALTGIPEGTIRNAMAWNGPSELSGGHMLRLVAVFGPAFLAAVLDPVPGWVAASDEGGGS
ncbi:MAG: hypothetical protein FD152_3692 [Xanthobacteraceae bacterium]|nr:MAG: hypothetical protein FD152_3692 [Xanthobacteraceae bacterium]